ncbi:hypothetical protein A606_08695 [Corynebacterium terpenotabidum Y-11]|uniref:Uncharacterized protein n=1 Tax=Corynebacterium terpenotabidum Y-11 TaxID=1200352 RepID=S4XE08_9CORY|nr:hypothetical protein A606_08695 [Corynebacterium terpenotabidum Y-11]
MYLRRPAGQATVPDRGPGDDPGGTGPDSGALLSGITGSSGARAAATAEISRLLTLWLDAFDGRRPVTALRRGPFSPVVLDHLRGQIRGQIRDSVGARAGSPSRLLRVHLPPSHHRRLAFTASAAVDGRVRALVGHLARYDARWRVESVTLL